MIDSNNCRNRHCTARRFWGLALAAGLLSAAGELLLVIIGWVFVMEALSVILQVGSFKLTGKRIFAMSPIHHHYRT